MLKTTGFQCDHLFLLSTAKMAKKNKTKKSASANSGTPKKGAKQSAKKRQTLPDLSLNHLGGLSLESDPSLNGVMDLFVNISSRLPANEQIVDQLRADKNLRGSRETPKSVPSTCHPRHK